MKNLNKYLVEELTSSEINSVIGGDEPAYGMSYYAHFVWDFLTTQYTGDSGVWSNGNP